jgi:hypothetical protein
MTIDKTYKNPCLGGLYDYEPSVSGQEELCKKILGAYPENIGCTKEEAFKEGIRDGAALYNGDLLEMDVKYGGNACADVAEAETAVAFLEYFHLLNDGRVAEVTETRENGTYVTKVGGLKVRSGESLRARLEEVQEIARMVASSYM